MDKINSGSDANKTDSIENKHIHYATTPCTNYFIMKKTKTSLRYNDYDNGNNLRHMAGLNQRESKEW